jgi:cyclopropane-fatty-acyl-phospholipid synthase
MSTLGWGIDLAERGWLPDLVLRQGIRRLCRERLIADAHADDATREKALQSLLADMTHGEIAPVPDAANQQHYELPAEFFAAVLGPHQKYSCGYWDRTGMTLAEAEIRALELTCEHARLEDGQRILELGCGWGSLSIWMAERFPLSSITAVSNSRPQRKWIEARAANAGLKNLRVITADMNEFGTAERFDRVVSVEMFEHMRNYQQLLARIATWLNPSGALFVHHFCHRHLAYPYETAGAGNWMGRYFFTGGLMPSEDLLSRFPDHFTVAQRWWWSGDHYQKTSEAWLSQLDAHERQVMPILTTTYGPENARRWFHRWRMFFLAVAEFFGLNSGREWGVTHQLLRPV